MRASVLAPAALVHLISTLSPDLNLEMSKPAGTVQLTPATVTTLPLIVRLPWTSIVSGFGGFGGLQPPDISTTALPPAAPPPSLPFVKPPPDVQSADRLATSLLHPAEPRPSARPAMCEPPEMTPSNQAEVWLAPSMRTLPETKPSPAELTITSASTVAFPVRLVSPAGAVVAAVPVQRPRVVVYVTLSEPVHVEVWTLLPVVAV